MGSFGLEVADTYDDLSRLAADAVQAVVDQGNSAVVTLPTGSTPLGMYEELVRRAKLGSVDFRNTQVFCLDDYLGKTRDDTASLTRWLYDVFLTPAAIGDEHIHRLPTTSAHPAEAADRYDKTIVESGGLDLAVIGIGPNGHIAFNEPGSAPNSRTRVVDLTEKSRNQSAEYWEGSAVIPEQAMTMGLGTILDARKLVLIASGSEKADMVRRALEEPPTLEVPGSWLQTAGSRLHVILDRDASRALRHS